MPIREYIDIKGKIHKYKYLVSTTKRKPKCPNCNYALNFVFINHNSKGHIKIGYFCPNSNCNQVYIYNNKKVFLIKFNNKKSKKVI